MRAAVRNGSCIRLGPKVSWIGWIPAKFQRNKVVLFVIAFAYIRIAVFLDLFTLQVRRVAGFRAEGSSAPSRTADRLVNVFLSNVRIRRAGSAHRAGISVRRAHMR